MRRLFALSLVCFLAYLTNCGAMHFSPVLEDDLTFEALNTSYRRDANHFIMSGYQTNLYRSGECDISVPGDRAPFQATVINWIALYWTYSGLDNEDMWIVVEAETRGWVGMGFTDSNMALEGSEVVKGYILKNEDSAALDKVEIASYRLGKEGWSDTTDNSKKVPIDETSVCQTSDGRTILKFKRKTRAGKHPVDAWVGTFGYVVVAVGETDQSSNVVEHAEFSISPWQSKVGPQEPEGWSFRWVFTYLLLYFHIITWLLH